MEQGNKKILLNTGVVYARLVITTLIGLLSSRYVLLALGASDFGLYAVVGGVISMLNILSAAMYTTTQRFINVEMGNPQGNLNRIFNISLVLHFGFAILIFLVAETIGLYYIYNYLNVSVEKFSDAVFVFHISTIAAAVGIINVPFQALIQANEKFIQLAAVDILNSITRLLLIVGLLYIEGNSLRLYAIGMSALTVFTLCFYFFACQLQWRKVVEFHIYKKKEIYKKILVFNNYVALGAFSYISRTQASNMLVNYFFGTIVNAAFAIGYTIENYCMIFLSCVGSAAEPQIAQNYAGNNQRSVFLTEILNRISIFLVLLIVVPLFVEIDFVLKLWLKNIPDGTSLICSLTLLSALVRVLFGGMDKIVQASGKNKWFQISGSIIQLSVLPIGYIYYRMGYPAYTIITIYIYATIASSIVSFYLLWRILDFDVKNYFLHVHIPAFKVLSVVAFYVYLYSRISVNTVLEHVMGIIACFLVAVGVIFLLGLSTEERKLFMSFLLRYKKNT